MPNDCAQGIPMPNQYRIVISPYAKFTGLRTRIPRHQGPGKEYSDHDKRHGRAANVQLQII
jgi:hypothetical protein